VLATACGQKLVIFIASSILILFIFLHIETDNFVNTLTAYAEDMENISHRTSGGATPGAEPTPQKRGPLPIPNWRRGRLPSCLARPRRPPLSLVLLVPYKCIHNTLNLISEDITNVELVVGAARAQL
jgi:hypothetical protein